MSNASDIAGQPPADLGPGTNDKILFWASFFTLIAAGVGFSVRGAILGDWSQQFGFTRSELGTITGGGLVGFGLTIILFSFIADRVGYGRLMIVAFLLHTASGVVTLAAGPVYAAFGKDATYWCLYVGMFLFALGNGTCEAVINPLTATLFPRNKTHWLNILHAGWPGGLILGALLGLLFAEMKVRWEVQMATFLVPTLLYGAMMFGRRFPQSEAKVHGVTAEEMRQELGLLGAGVVVALLGLWFSDLLAGFGLPGVLGWGVAVVLLVIFGYSSQFRVGHWMLALLLVLHALVGYVELGTDSWITNITGTILENKQLGLMLFIWTSGLMFALRFFAGPIVHQISPLGLLCGSAVLGTFGLLLLGWAEGFLLLAVAATIYGIGKTFYWPTMLGVVSERFPRGGALTLGAIGGAGMLSAGILGGPGIGYKQDYFASQKLEVDSPHAYERYVARKEDGELNKKGFLSLPGIPKVAGLDGQKVGTLLGQPGEKNGGGKLLQADLNALKVAASKSDKDKDKTLDQLLAEPQNKGLKAQVDWWEGTGPHLLPPYLLTMLNSEEQTNWWTATGGKPGAKDEAEHDKKPVEAATLEGGKMALTTTAFVPALMALGYLFLIMYFRTRGGYTAQVLVGHAAKDEKFTGGTEGPGEG